MDQESKIPQTVPVTFPTNPLHTLLPVLFACALVGPSVAAAQEMGQGQAHITARADVRLALESGPGTRSSKLQEIGEVLGRQLGAVRRCYRDVVQQRPTVEGTLRITVAVDGDGHVDVTRDELNDAELTQCTIEALRAAALRDVRPPGSAYLTLTYSNTAAAGVAATRERRAVEDQVEVTTNSDGKPEARGGNAGGEVSFVVTGMGRNPSAEQVAAMQRSLRAAIPILLDCRRRAARRTSPAGDTTLIVSVPRRGRARIQVRRSTVENPRGGRCLARFLGRHTFEQGAAGRTQVVVTFTGNEAMPVRTEEGQL